jgi:two-component system LytT family response regulator
MSTYTALLVDDEAHGRRLLQKYLSTYCHEIDVLDEARTVQEAYEKIVSLKPQIIFLDIALMNESAFDLLAKFEQIPFEIIFITAYNDFAIRAIKLSAVDYLLKPVDIEQLVNAVQKAIARIDEKGTMRHFRFLMENLKQRESIHKVALPTQEGYVFVEISQIIRCEAAGSYTEFHFANRKPIVVSKGLKEYEDLLEHHHFIRIHHSHLIQLNHVSAYHKGKASYVTMADGSSVEVSIRKRDEFLMRLNELRA